METLLIFALLLTRVCIFGSLALIVWQMLTGKIRLHGMLADKERGLPVSPARVQALMSTLGVGSYLLTLALELAKNGRHEMPTVPSEALLLLGGSHMFYLGSKASARNSQSTN